MNFFSVSIFLFFFSRIVRIIQRFVFFIIQILAEMKNIQLMYPLIAHHHDISSASSPSIQSVKIVL